MPPFKTFRFTGWSGGLYASANTFDQPQGTVPRISNLLFAERGGLNTVDGSHVVVRPGPPPAPLGFVSSGPLTSVQPPAPTVIGSAQAAFNSTGNRGPFGSPVLPINISVSLPVSILPGDLLIAVVTVTGWSPGAGAHLNPIDSVPGWTVVTSNIALNPFPTMLAHAVTGSEGTSVTFQYSGPVFNYSGFTLNGYVIALRGANTLTPLDASNFQTTGPSSGALTAAGVTTTFTNDILLISMTDNGNAGSPGNVSGTVNQLNVQSPGGQPIGQTLALWTKAFAGPGATGNFISPSGWAAGSNNGEAVLAIGTSVPPAGQLMGFQITANGLITPVPIIQGAATSLTAPQGTFKDLNGKLWTADAQSENNGAIMGYFTPQNEGGNTAPDALIQGPSHSLLANPYDVAVDTGGKIYVANYAVGATGGILIYNPGSSGDVAPAAQIGGGNTGLVHPRSVAVDGSGNVYVLDDTINSIKIWLAGHTGNVAPDQTIVGALTQINNPLAVRIDPNGLLWITCGSTNTPTPAFLLQFKTTDNGNVAPTIRIDSTSLQPQLGFGGPTGLAFDVNANIYVAVLGNKNVIVFPAGSSGTVNPTQLISGFPNGPWGVGVTE